MSARTYYFSGGGTGGHLFPGLAVANAVRRRDAQARIVFFTTARELDRTLLARTDFQQVPQQVRPFSTKPWHWPAFLSAWRGSLADAARHIRQDRPAAILGLGGYAAAPPVVVGRKLGFRTAILNPDAVPGKANRHLGRQVDRIFAQWHVTRTHFARNAPVEIVGCPIRPEFQTADAATAHRTFRLTPERPVLLVTGASQGAGSINETLLRIWPAFHGLHPEWQLLHLTGPADETRIRAAYDAIAGDPAFHASTHVVGFTHEMAAALAAADVVIARAGASTLAELTALGKPSILLPYPWHRDQHQHANAGVLVDAGAALLVEDLRDGTANAAPVRAALDQLAAAEIRRKMSAAAATLARTDAAERVADWMVAAGAG